MPSYDDQLWYPNSCRKFMEDKYKEPVRHCLLEYDQAVVWRLPFNTKDLDFNWLEYFKKKVGHP